MKRWAPVACVLLLGDLARAEAPRVKADVNPEVVQPGAPFEVQIEATSSQGVSELSVPTPAGLKKLGEHRTTTSSIVMSPQGTERRQGLSVVYTFSGDKVGTYRIGPIAIRVGSTRYSSDGPRVQIAKDAPAPNTRSRDPFGGLFGKFGFDSDPFFDSPPPQRGTVDPSLALPAARGDVLFFHARVDPKDVVLGQRLTFDVLEYVEDGVRPPDFVDVHEAKTDDFLSKPIEVKREPREIGNAEVAGKRYVVKLFRRYQLTPLRAGKLEIGPLVGQVPTRSGKTASRESETITVVVREPPAAGRPNGYQLGTVGSYELKAEPLPATLQTGEHATLIVHCTGAGAPPSKLQFRDFGNALKLSDPVIEDHENGAPQLVDPIPGLDDSDPRFATVTRTFKYLIEAREPGRLELGSVAVPTYLPAEKRYDSPSTPLGVIEISGAAKVEDANHDDGSDERVVLDLGAPLDALAGSPPATPATLPSWAYAVPLATPALSWLWVWLAGAARRGSEKRKRAATPSLRAQIDAALERGDVASLQQLAKLLMAHRAGSETAPPRDEWDALVRDDADERERFQRWLAALDEARYAGLERGLDELRREAAHFRTQWGP